MEEATKKTTEEIQAEISRAMQGRVRDFKEQADTLTLEGVRRALEGDMEMEKFSLDVHKKFIKQCLNECFEAADETESKTLGTAEEETPIQHENLPLEKTSSALDGLGNEVDIRKGSKYDNVVSEEKIRKAVKKRAAYIREKIEKITSAEVRRLLEEDLKLEKNTLDSYKGFISKELDEVLLAPESVEATNGVEKPKKSSHGKASGKTSSISKSASEDSDSLDSRDGLSGDEKATEIRKPKRRRVQKIKAGTQGLKKQKKSPAQSKPISRKKPVDSDLDKDSESEGGKSSDGSGEEVMEEAKPRNRPAPKSKASTQGLKKQKTSTATPSSMKKPKTSDLDKDSESEGGDPSEGNHSNSSAEESIKKKVEKPTQAYGKQVEHLKSIIKSCGIGIPPSVYKRAKQAPESKREAFLIKELEEILDREGLSSNPSEKDIKVVKKKKERAKELEGIDMSNIVSSSRRRTTSNFIPSPKPKVEVDEDEDEDDEDNEDDEEDTDDDGDSGEGSDEDEESD